MNGTETQLPLPKRLLAALFALVLVVGMAPVSAWAAGGDDSNDGSNEQQVADNNVTISFQGSKDENLQYKNINKALSSAWGITPTDKDGAFYLGNSYSGAPKITTDGTKILALLNQN